MDKCHFCGDTVGLFKCIGKFRFYNVCKACGNRIVACQCELQDDLDKMGTELEEVDKQAELDKAQSNYEEGYKHPCDVDPTYPEDEGCH